MTESDSQTTSTDLLRTPVGPVPPEVTPGTPYDALPDLAGVHQEAIGWQNETKVFNGVFMEGAFVAMGIELIVLEWE